MSAHACYLRMEGELWYYSAIERGGLAYYNNLKQRTVVSIAQLVILNRLYFYTPIVLKNHVAQLLMNAENCDCLGGYSATISTRGMLKKSLLYISHSWRGGKKKHFCLGLWEKKTLLFENHFWRGFWKLQCQKMADRLFRGQGIQKTYFGQA